MLNEFKKFAMRGNVVDMAVGIIIGGAFGANVTTVVGDVLMPVVGLALGGADLSELHLRLRDGATPRPNGSLAAAREAGAVALAYGVLVNAAVNFTIVAFALFLDVKGMNNLKRQEAAAPAAPPAASKEEVLLTEIRDLLAGRQQGV
jgi:large conductance mechanosensitive channel